MREKHKDTVSPKKKQIRAKIGQSKGLETGTRKIRAVWQDLHSSKAEGRLKGQMMAKKWALTSYLILAEPMG